MAQDARDTSPNGLSDQGRNPPTAPSPPTDSIRGKSDPTGQRHLQGVPVPGAPEDTYLRSQDTYPHRKIPTPPLRRGYPGHGAATLHLAVRSRSAGSPLPAAP